MALNEYSREQLVIGKKALQILKDSRVAVFGIGGVGGNAVEALARAGVGTLDLIDNDEVNITNINRQLIATHDTIGRAKVEVAKERIHAINPEITVHTYQEFYLPSNRDRFDFTEWDYIIDAIDTVTAKLDIIEQANIHGVPIISCMGCGNRVDPTKLVITDIYKTSNDPLARIMRYKCRKMGIKKLTVVCSTELPIKPLHSDEDELQNVPGSTSFVPPVAGIIAASKVMRDLTSFDPNNRE